MKFRLLILVFVVFFSCEPNISVIELPSIFCDNMILQRNSEAQFWGSGHNHERITVTPSWDGREYKVEIDEDGNWITMLATPEAGGPYEISIKGKGDEFVLKNVVIGDIWLCSGQSNMEWSANSGIDNAEVEIANANFPNIRLFSVEKTTADTPQENVNGTWQVCTPATMQDFSAVAYFFAKKVQEETGIPIGLIDASWGGTPAEVWTPERIFEENEKLKEAAKAIEPTDSWPTEPTIVHNAMIAPITPFKITGALWYQGESNVPNAETYQKLFTEMIGSWRKSWGYDFPFYYSQIAPFKYGTPEAGVIVRDQQRRAMEFPNTGMVLTSDICTIDDIHPTNKQDVGLRLANVALKEHYKSLDAEVYGPLYKEMIINGNEVEVIFKHAEGLTWKEKGERYLRLPAKMENFFQPKRLSEMIRL
ncbi:sialate O-acetylesterase [Maribacter halichondriae]|uniref:sialate O-acetylesterase n=1 Tax=Maribacter halichondriae TaxID=2980554 RepID=UPI0023595A33|nr:sialate O-acetylesterase [Maribacter sp. Hal144]